MNFVSFFPTPALSGSGQTVCLVTSQPGTPSTRNDYFVGIDFSGFGRFVNLKWQLRRTSALSPKIDELWFEGSALLISLLQNG